MTDEARCDEGVAAGALRAGPGWPGRPLLRPARPTLRRPRGLAPAAAAAAVDGAAAAAAAGSVLFGDYGGDGGAEREGAGGRDGGWGIGREGSGWGGGRRLAGLVARRLVDVSERGCLTTQGSEWRGAAPPSQRPLVNENLQVHSYTRVRKANGRYDP
jgi:hypothetical protein